MDLGARRGYVGPVCMPAPRPSKPVLLIDDNEDVRVSMKTLLELDGYSVVAASEGEDALTKLRGFSGLQRYWIESRPNAVA